MKFSGKPRRGSALVLCLLILAAMSMIVLAFLAATSQARDNARGRATFSAARNMALMGQMFFMYRADEVAATPTRLGDLDSDFRLAHSESAPTLARTRELWKTLVTGTTYSTPDDTDASVQGGGHWKYFVGNANLTNAASRVTVTGVQPLQLLDKEFRPVPMRLSGGVWVPDETTAKVNVEDIKYIGRYALTWINLRGRIPLTKVVAVADGRTYEDLNPIAAGTDPMTDPRYELASLLTRDPTFSRPTVTAPNTGYDSSDLNSDAKKIFDYYRDLHNEVVSKASISNTKKFKLLTTGATTTTLLFPYTPFRLSEDVPNSFINVPGGSLSEKFLTNPFGGSGTDYYGWGRDNRVDVVYANIATATTSTGIPTMAPVIPIQMTARTITSPSPLLTAAGTSTRMISQITQTALFAGLTRPTPTTYLVSNSFKYSGSPATLTAYLSQSTSTVFHPVGGSMTAIDYTNGANTTTTNPNHPRAHSIYLPVQHSNGSDVTVVASATENAPYKALNKEMLVMQDVVYSKPPMTIDIRTAPKDVLKAVFLATYDKLAAIRVADPWSNDLFFPDGSTPDPVDVVGEYYPLVTNKKIFGVDTTVADASNVTNVYVLESSQVSLPINQFTSISASSSGTLGLSSDLITHLYNDNRKEWHLFGDSNTVAPGDAFFKFSVAASVAADAWAERVIAVRGSLKPHEDEARAHTNWNASAAFNNAAGDDGLANMIGRILAGIWTADNDKSLVDLLAERWLYEQEIKFSQNLTGTNNGQLYLVGDLPGEQVRLWAMYYAQMAHSRAAAKLIVRTDLFRVVVKGQLVEGSWDGTSNAFVPSLDEDSRPIVASEENLEFVYRARQDNPLVADAAVAGGIVAGNDENQAAAISDLRQEGVVLYERWYNLP